MQGRLLAPLAILVLLGVGLAGCMSQPEFQNAGVSEVSARQNVELAANAAKAWSEKAGLVGIGGAEARDGNDAMIAGDPDVGNGLATSWSYVYQSPAGEHRAFEVTADGTVVSKNETDAAADYGGMYGAYAGAYQAYRSQSTSSKGEALGDWSWDSDAALAAALRNETFASAARAPNATLAEGLGQSGTPAAWAFLATASHRTVLAMVNATSGEVIGVHDFSRYSMKDAQQYASAKTPPTPPSAPKPPAAAEPVEIQDSGSLSAAAPKKEIPFTVTGPVKGPLNLTASFSGDATDLAWKIVKGTKTVASGSTGGVLLSSQTSSTVKITDPGDYKLVLTVNTIQGAVPVGSVSYDLAAKLMPTG
jgi:hypothetical protein